MQVKRLLYLVDGIPVLRVESAEATGVGNGRRSFFLSFEWRVEWRGRQGLESGRCGEPGSRDTRPSGSSPRTWARLYCCTAWISASTSGLRHELKGFVGVSCYTVDTGHRCFAEQRTWLQSATASAVSLARARGPSRAPPHAEPTTRPSRCCCSGASDARGHGRFAGAASPAPRAAAWWRRAAPLPTWLRVRLRLVVRASRSCWDRGGLRSVPGGRYCARRAHAQTPRPARASNHTTARETCAGSGLVLAECLGAMTGMGSRGRCTRRRAPRTRPKIRRARPARWLAFETHGYIMRSSPKTPVDSGSCNTSSITCLPTYQRGTAPCRGQYPSCPHGP